MSNSGRKINYSIRPGKNIERKMMRDAFSRLLSFDSLKNYRYVGFGAKYFVDFNIFHKYLGIDDMVSIESDVSNKERYRFNCPFSCIRLEYGKSTDVLPKLGGWDKRTILWMDYDQSFCSYMLSDIALTSRSLVSGSVYAFSFNCAPILSGSIQEDEAELLEAKLIEMVGRSNVPPGIDARGWRKDNALPVFIRDCVNAQIEKVLKSRNIGLADEEKMQFKQILFFKYSDNAPMATLAFVFFSKKDRALYDGCRFNEFYFYRDGRKPFEIKVPNLTMKEIRHIMEVMPSRDKLSNEIFADKDIDGLWENYRYFPSFTEVESF